MTCTCHRDSNGDLTPNGCTEHPGKSPRAELALILREMATQVEQSQDVDDVQFGKTSERDSTGNRNGWVTVELAYSLKGVG